MLDKPSNGLIFDEAYYVNAARMILGIRVPSSEHYAGSPAGLAPLGAPATRKLLIALGMKVFGRRDG